MRAHQALQLHAFAFTQRHFGRSWCPRK
jgi:hypothetical protein